MTRSCDLELMLVHLEAVLEYARQNGFDAHFIAEVEHLISTVEANK